MKWLISLFADYKTNCNMPFGHQDALVGELLATKVKLNNTEKAIQRVRELHKPSDILVRWKDLPPAPDCDHCEHRYPCPTIEALDGEQS